LHQSNKLRETAQQSAYSAENRLTVLNSKRKTMLGKIVLTSSER